jgi:hypothetical protein
MDQPLKLKPSTHAHGARYDPDAERLTLDLNGGTFAVHNVPVEKAQAYADADSHGDFFFKNFQGQHEITRVR